MHRLDPVATLQDDRSDPSAWFGRLTNRAQGPYSIGEWGGVQDDMRPKIVNF